MSRSKTVGKDAMSQAQRTSTTWFHHFKTVPQLISKCCRLMGLDDITRWEEPQTVRYRGSEKFTWHLDALSPSDELQISGGQRVATVLVYLNDVEEGGATMFRDLTNDEEDDETAEQQQQRPLKVQPKKGTALVFFPSAGGVPNTPFDIRTLHAGEKVDPNSPIDKWIAQLWLREHANTYQPTAPPGNTHAVAEEAVREYCTTAS